eukprot:2076138-Prymnesium_polylepis.1
MAVRAARLLSSAVARSRLPAARRAPLPLAAPHIGVYSSTPRRLLSTTSDGELQQARDFMHMLGYAPDVTDGVLANLTGPDWGLRPTQVHGFVVKMAGAYEIGADAGLAALAQAVERELAETRGVARVSFWVQPANGAAFECEGFAGHSLK